MKLMPYTLLAGALFALTGLMIHNYCAVPGAILGGLLGLWLFEKNQ